MPLLFKDYTELVIKAYEKEWAAGELSPLLIQPTTVNIKQECMNVYTERLEKGERVEVTTLQGFFRSLPEGINFIRVIESCSPDRFRPLQKLMRREVANPNLVNVELLAWLIDFQPRPFSRAQQLSAKNNETLEQTVDTVDTIGDVIVTVSDTIYETENNAVNNDADPETLEPDDQNDQTQDSDPDSFLEPEREKGTRPGILKKAAWGTLIAATLFGGYYFSRKPVIPDGESSKVSPVENKCKALTKSGTPCKRKANATGYCWQHEG